MKSIKAILFISLLTPLTAIAGPVLNGEKLLGHLEAYYQDKAENIETAIFVSYYMGFLRGISFYDGPDICTPVESSNSQLMLVVKKHLDDNPQKLHLRPEPLIIEALTASFPCETKKE